MDGGVIGILVLAVLAAIVVVKAMRAVSEGPTRHKAGMSSRFQQHLFNINKVPHPKGKGTVWVPSD